MEETYKQYEYRRNLRRRYHTTPEAIELLRQRQGNRCPLCEKQVKLVVDYSTATKTVRGLLCYKCHPAIRHWADDPKFLERMFDYVNNVKGLATPAQTG